MKYPISAKYFEDALKRPGDNSDHLASLSLMKNKKGGIYSDNGFFGTVFKMKDRQDGRIYAVKCFTKAQKGRDEAYRKISSALQCVRSEYIVDVEYLDDELYVYRGSEGFNYSVLKMEWVTGKTLCEYLRDADAVEKAMVAGNYCRMARWLLHQPFAHGDLKPDNIIVRADGSIVLLDYDGMYVPAMRGEKPRELGTKPYCHPLRRAETFDEHIDDYPAALIALLLRTVAAHPELEYDELLPGAGEPGFISKFEAYTADERVAAALAAYILVMSCGRIDAGLFDALLSYGDDIEAARRMAAGITAPEPPGIRKPAQPRKEPVKQRPNTINGHEYVDLGLSVKWATCNVGADKPEDYGGYYAWGETETKSSYDEDNCETREKKIGDIGGTSRDVAHVKWGGTWRLPTLDEIEELEDNCDYEWTTLNGVKGGKYTSRKNGNSIFLPAAGGRRGTSLYSAGEYGIYWSSTPIEGDTQHAYCLYFYSGYHDWIWYDRDYGRSVRPVSE